MIVIADDITGAAEIAGIAFSRGENVRLVCGCGTVTDGTTVIATDTRSMTEPEAVAETKRLSSYLSPLTSHLFKKTDSALRGHVVAELTALMEITGYQRAVYLPGNPSKGRIIRNGIYYINDVPIHETAFSYDPEFPAKTSVLKERFPDAEAQGIIMPDAESKEDILRVIATYDDGKTLFAGAADLFEAYIEVRGIRNATLCFAEKRLEVREMTKRQNYSLTSHLSPLTSNNSTLFLCGSTQSKPLDLGIPTAPMPRDIYDGSHDMNLWDTSSYAAAHSVILTMPYMHRTGKEAAVHLRTMMATKARQLVTEQCPQHLIIEGGATAWTTLQALGWTSFTITAQFAPGVVQMSATNGTLVTLKPGSYPWGNLFPAV